MDFLCVVGALFGALFCSFLFGSLVCSTLTLVSLFWLAFLFDSLVAVAVAVIIAVAGCRCRLSSVVARVLFSFFAFKTLFCPAFNSIIFISQSIRYDTIEAQVLTYSQTHVFVVQLGYIQFCVIMRIIRDGIRGCGCT